jgi:pimeloyl-ACP methyl ester carboxylesterase
VAIIRVAFRITTKIFIPLLNGVDYYLDQHTSIRKILVTGHSLGGAIAELFMDQHDDNGTVRMYRGNVWMPGNNYHR